MTPSRILVPILWLALIAAVFPAQVSAQRRSSDEVESIMRGLERGIKALQKVGGQERLIDGLKEVAAHTEQQFKASRREGNDRENQRERRNNTEREVARRQIHVMRLGMKALLQAKREDGAHLLEHGIHARELVLEGRRDKEARDVIRRAPQRGQLAELMGLAAEIHANRGNEEAAHACADVAKQFAGRRGSGDRERERKSKEGRQKRSNNEREVARHELKIKRWALEAIKESDNERAAKLMHQAIRALEVGIEGRRDEEAAKIRKSAPNLGAQTELLLLAGQIHKEKERPDKADACTRLGKHYQAMYHERALAKRERKGKGEREREHEREHEREREQHERNREREREQHERSREREREQHERNREREQRQRERAREGSARGGRRELGDLAERIEGLEQHVKNLERILEQLSGQLRRRNKIQ